MLKKILQEAPEGAPFETPNEDATVTLNDDVFADIGMSDEESRALAASIQTLRHSAGDF